MHPRIIPFAFPGNTVPMATFADAPGGASLRGGLGDIKIAHS